jgi:hypothetical protein
MKKTLSHLLSLVVAIVLLASCKKSQQEFNIVPKSSIVFDDNVDKISADYKKGTNLNLKIGVAGSATAVRVTSTYNVGASAKTKDLGVIPVANGAAVLNIPVSDLRNTADGLVVGAGSAPSSTRPENTYTLIVDANNADGSTERRYFTAVIVQ